MNDLLAVDTETTGLTFFDDAFGVSTFDGDGEGGWFELPDESEPVTTLIGAGPSTDGHGHTDRGRESVPEPLERPLVFHNAKFDLSKLVRAGVLPRRKRAIHDTEALAHLLDEHQPKKLKVLARKYLGVETDEETELKAYCRKKSNGINVKIDGYRHVPREILVPYALKDAEYTYRLFHVLYPQVARYEDLLGLYRMEMDLTWALLEMEFDGLGVNEEYVRDKIKEYSRLILETEWKIEDTTGLKVWYPPKAGVKTPEGHFNPNSNPQITEFFKAEGIDRDSYNKATLVELGHPLGLALIELRRLKKIRDTYLTAMLEESRDGVLHPHTRQHGTVTGRMSSGKAED
jgi:DNA polymerase I - 3''-5'' exonuclease and polymerase domains